MRGPHNLWRLIRTGATFERTGAMRTALEAFDAPPTLRVAARVLGWPFQWLGLRRRPDAAADPARASPRSGRPTSSSASSSPPAPTWSAPSSPPSSRCCRTSCRPSRWRRRAPRRDRARPAARRGLRRLRAAGRRRLAGAGPPRHAARDRPDRRGQGAAPRHRARLPARRRRLLLRRRHGRAPRPLRPAAAPEGGDPALRGRGPGRARPPDGGRRRRRVRRQHRARPGLPRARGDLARLRPPGADPGMGDAASTSATCRRCAPAAPTSCGSPSGSSRPS